eukprot:TRINITY_DN1142_c0_g3_i11.p1 TRINITY_DN1142_c0_g3~~TRINITY_DN1142_c0_g3_i11.p1  ORF type:complete len:325 (-),score=54.22 TRINITY_DN1142_c0_g3_i11:106-1080(-)
MSANNYRELYPPIEAYKIEFLEVGDGHTLYVEQSGNPKGKPVVVLHGGPGGGCEPFYRQYFDPSVYRIINFDQRGAGKSTPFASLHCNTTWHLVADIEKIRNHLGISKWLVFGGSWGSTLAIAYAETHPEYVVGLVLRGIFMLRRKELLWFYQEGASFVFPDAWDKYVSPIPLVERGDLISAYHRRLAGENEEEKLKCAHVWTTWEMTTSRLHVDAAAIARAQNDKFALAFARIECHYFVNGGFFREDEQLLKDLHKIKHISNITIVQGRYDMVCPAISAWELYKALDGKPILDIVPDAGHSAKEPGITSKLIEATDRYRTLDY